MLKNYMEIAVDMVLKGVLKSKELECMCEKCLDDIRAITLNKLKPMYVVSDEGVLYSKLQELSVQFRADILRELTQAIAIVEESPRH
ncbi:MAG TPA: late competence development ComFB family protein [Tissierellaceae bacterium]|nr:late competence development ComFB family protein [Tissierellaceae bacterium]